MDQTMDQHLAEFVRYAYEKAPAVRSVFDGAAVQPADIQTVDDLSRVPVTSKDRLIELQQSDPPFGGFLATSRESLQRMCVTPGPIYVPWAQDEAVAMTYRRAHAVAGFGPGDVVILAISYHFNPVALAVDKELRDAGVTVIAGGIGNADLQLRMMSDLRVTGFHGLPSWLMALLKRAEDEGVDVRKEWSLRKVHAAGEPLPPAMREAFTERYGLQVANLYAIAELGVLAYNTTGGYEMRLFESPIIQVADLETGQPVGPGEVGEVVVTSFNRTFPTIRLGTGDLAMNLDPAPGESRQQDRSIILVGRTGDAVKVRGIFVHPNQLRFASSRVPGVARTQAVVTRSEHRDALTLRVVLAEDAVDAAARASVEAGLSGAIRSLCRIGVDRFEYIDPGTLEDGADILIDARTWN